MPNNEPDVLTLTDLAQKLGVSPSTLKKWRLRGVFPPAKRLPNGRVVVHKDDFDTWFADLPDVSWR